MPREFEPGRIVRKMDFTQVDSWDLDNGEVKARLDLNSLRGDLSHAGVTQAGIKAVCDKLARYVDQVDTEKAKGVHVGSSSLAMGLSSEIWGMSPQELGLQTETEVKLVAKLVERLTIESK